MGRDFSLISYTRFDLSTRRVDEQEEEEEEERPSSFVFVEGVVRINAML